MEAGFSLKKVLINLTDMTDSEFEDLLLYAEEAMEENYKRIFKMNNKYWFILPVIFYLRKLKKIFDLGVWRRKLQKWFYKKNQMILSREEIEEQYFNLEQVKLNQ